MISLSTACCNELHNSVSAFHTKGIPFSFALHFYSLPMQQCKGHFKALSLAILLHFACASTVVVHIFLFPFCLKLCLDLSEGQNFPLRSAY